MSVLVRLGEIMFWNIHINPKILVALHNQALFLAQITCPCQQKNGVPHSRPHGDECFDILEQHNPEYVSLLLLQEQKVVELCSQSSGQN